jgi:solute carrier family 39 (zinc transporter), member 7
MRILAGDTHDHHHGTSSQIDTSSNGVSTTIDSQPEKETLRRRKREVKEVPIPSIPEESKQVKVSAWLCIISDFTHNITDGLAISASFYISPSIGAVTTMAVFFHG